MILFKFDPMKAIQAVAFLLNVSQMKMCNYLKVLKLLYCANRDSLKETGCPVLGCQILAMKHGPVLLGVYSMMKDQGRYADIWRQYFSRAEVGEHILVQIGEPGDNKLSPYEKTLLTKVYKAHAWRNEWSMVDWTHVFPEWKKAWKVKIKKGQKKGNSYDISNESILKELGFSEEDIEELAREQEMSVHFDKVLGL